MNGRSFAPTRLIVDEVELQLRVRRLRARFLFQILGRLARAVATAPRIWSERARAQSESVSSKSDVLL